MTAVPARSYRDYLDRRGRQPLVIERTSPKAGHVVLTSQRVYRVDSCGSYFPESERL